jgi:C1A family cysteine protease
MNVRWTAEGLGLGWLPDHPDHRDFSHRQDKPPDTLPELRSVQTMLGTLSLKEPTQKLPSATDLRAGFSPVENQGQLGSCTANAGVGMLEYFERTAGGRHVDASRLFLYKATRNLMGQTGDTGAFLRTTMQALVLFGAPPEEYWPYDVATFDNEPTAFCYSFAQNYKSLQYFRLDPMGTAPDELLSRIKSNLAGNLPAMFGFTVFSSYTQAADNGGAIPYPVAGDRRVGGHAIVACGYDDAKKITNTGRGAESTTGALLIRNSWGDKWGDQGYGWLPYKYVLDGLAQDWWCLLKSEWVDTGVFGLGK